MRKWLAAWLALALSANPLFAAETSRGVERVGLETPAVTLQTPGLNPSLVNPVVVPGLDAAVPSLPPTALPSAQARAEAELSPLPQAFLDQPAANDKEASRGAELQAAQQTAKFDGAKIADKPGEIEVLPALSQVPKSAPRWRSLALAVMAAGSLNLSRTTTVGRKWFAPAHMSNEQVAARAEKNFRQASLLVVDHARELPLSRATAVRLNRMLTDGLVPDEVRGDPDYHTDTTVFYKWLESKEAQELAERDPVEMAQQLHYKMSRLDSFADGNGRLARLMADLALIQGGYAPVFYSDMGDYFARGNHRSKVGPAERRAYFREMAARGQRAVSDPEWFEAELRQARGIDRGTLRAVQDREGHAGKAVMSRKQERALKAQP